MTSRSPPADRTSEIRILPVVSAGDRTVLIDWLDDRYDVVTAVDPSEPLHEGTIDLCILDPANFDRYRDVLIDARETARPRILPYLLVHPGDGPLVDPDARQYVDDVIVTPISQRELAWRVESLLQLREFSLELERRNAQLEYLVSAGAHDLRNALNIAHGYVELLDDSDPVDRIRNALDRMEGLVNNLLTVHRIEQGVTEEHLEPVDLPTLVSECWDVTPGTNADIEVTLPADTRIRAKPDLARQLVENLLRNAIDHGGETVTVRVGTLDEGDGFYVADNGSGIPVSDRETVFEYGHSTGAGSGIGLSIVKHVVDVHGWDVRVTESETGGARFEISDVVVTGC